jgi:hypothetical protein
MKLKLLPLYLGTGLLGLLALVASVFILPFRANAATPESILVDMVPANPAPGESTTINLSSYENNIDSVLITWSVAGKNTSSGIGKKSFSINAPAVGSSTTITATISLPDGDIEKTIVIRPTIMTLLWQADDSYVPPFYKGKAMPSPESTVKVIAMPEIQSGSKMVDPTNMVYAWKQDYTNNVDGSGYGKNSFVYTNDYLDDSNNVDVVASTIDGSYSSEASIDIGTTQPKIEFYKNDPNLGTIWELALTDGHKVDNTETMQAAPYFISPQDIRIPILTWNWSINDNGVDVPIYSPNLLPLKTQAGVSGTAKIDLEIRNSYKVFVDVSKEINVVF